MTPYSFGMRYAWANAYFQLLWESNPCFRDAMLSLDAERISQWSERLGILLPALLGSIEEVSYLACSAGVEPHVDAETLFGFVRAALLAAPTDTAFKGTATCWTVWTAPATTI